MIFCYKFNFQLIKRKPLLSKIEQVEMLIALGKGDKYRLMNIRQSLESGKELFISDKDFLQDLIKTHLGDKIYQARIVSISEKPNLFCEECGSEISADEKFCVSCGTQKPEPISSSTVNASEPIAEPETTLEAGSGEQQATGGFALTADGDIGDSSTKETARESLTRKITELETKLDEQAKAPRKTVQIKLKPESKKKSRQQELEEYEKKHLGKSKTKVSRKTYKVKATRKIAQIKLKPEPKKKSRQQELEEYERKYLNEPEGKKATPTEVPKYGEHTKMRKAVAIGGALLLAFGLLLIVFGSATGFTGMCWGLSSNACRSDFLDMMFGWSIFWIGLIPTIFGIRYIAKA